MSSQGSRASNKITDDELNALVVKLQALLPQLNHGRHGRVSSSTTKVVKETCSYIRRLQKEVDDLGERLSQCLDSMDISSSDVEILTNLLHH
ncbi:BANQUO 3, BASIC HELIX-LOOP-HELIX PROTEIN 161 [Hibiscus trionum]|uniref:BANQUO 3, BASIC HELIX-LOOP-HELIX PROTEIN 161 n=1 Tax=Hibiscus trionum TaxID=183268 RepID=A0A9W7J2M5_HIBTR|nr:BANQUO 3, BASIC HELIX-LOOP-HELIX PROTEIN 161 [Hibiscus trionum]